MKILSIDVETNGIEYWKTSLVSYAVVLGDEKGNITVKEAVLVEHPEAELTIREALDKLQKLIKKTDIIVGANFKFDYNILSRYNIEFYNIPIHDILYIEYLYSMQTKKHISLNDLAHQYLNKSKDDINFTDMQAGDYPADVLLKYNLTDTLLTYEIYLKQIASDDFQTYNKLIRLGTGLIRLLSEIELNGCVIDVAKLQQLKIDYETTIRDYEEKITELLEYPVNINSSQQLSAALYGGSFLEDGVEEIQKTLKSGQVKTYQRKCKVERRLKGLGFKPTLTTPNGEPSTSEDAIKTLKCRTLKQKKFKELYLNYKKLMTIYIKYLDKYEAYIEDRKIHSNFMTTATHTGRLSSSKPNIQQIPRETEGINIRDLFISRYPDGYILELDFKQLEWRIAAALCGDETMIQEIIEGKDAHRENAALAFNISPEDVTPEQRQIAKAVSFGLIYGQTAYGMAHYRPDIPVDTVEEAQAIINKVYGKYPKLAKWHSKLIATATNYKSVSVPSGRRFYFASPDAATNIKNYPVQGFSFDIAYFLFSLLADKYKTIVPKDKYAIFNTVHDCLVIDCYDKNIVEKIVKFSLDFIEEKSYYYIKKFFGDIQISEVPLSLEAEYGKSWGKLEPYEIKKEEV